MPILKQSPSPRVSHALTQVKMSKTNNWLRHLAYVLVFVWPAGDDKHDDDDHKCNYRLMRRWFGRVRFNPTLYEYNSRSAIYLLVQYACVWLYGSTLGSAQRSFW